MIWPVVAERTTTRPCGLVGASGAESLSTAATRSPDGLRASAAYSWRVAAPTGADSAAATAAATWKRTLISSISAGDRELDRLGERGLGLACRETGEGVDRSPPVVSR